MKTSKSCGDDGTNYKCDWCDFETNLKFALTTHQSKCKFNTKVSTYKDTIELLAKKNKELRKQNKTLTIQNAVLQGKIEMLEKRPPTNIKNIFKNNKIQFVLCDKIKPLTDQTIDEAIANGSYTFEHYIRGIPGLIDFITPIIKQEEERNYACTDGARNNFKRLGEEREWIDDKKAGYIHTILTKLRPEVEKYKEQLSNKDEKEYTISEGQSKQLRYIHRAVTMPNSIARADIFTAVRTGVKTVALI
jgi:FtsZ-binding cell division protein ZapB